MKRIGIYLMLILMITIPVSCNSGKKQTEDITKKYSKAKEYSAIVKVRKGDGEYTIKLTKTNGNTIKGEITEPSILKGFWMELTEEKYKVGYMGLDISSEKIPESADSVVNYLFQGIKLLEGNAKNITQKAAKNGDITLSGRLSNGMNASITFDSGTLLPIKINFDNNLSINFESFNITA